MPKAVPYEQAKAQSNAPAEALVGATDAERRLSTLRGGFCMSTTIHFQREVTPMGKLIEMPKTNAHHWENLFNSFVRDIDKVQQHLQPDPEGHVGEDGGWIPDKEEK